MDGAALEARNFYVGQYGLALLDHTSWSAPEDFDLAWSPRAPHFVDGFDPGIFAWHDMTGPCQGGVGTATTTGVAGPESADFEGKEQIQDGKARTALKELGYWK
jgi:hypothetical protein